MKIKNRRLWELVIDILLLRRRIMIIVAFFYAGFMLQMCTRLNVEISQKQKVDKVKFDQYYNIDMAPEKPDHAYIVNEDHLNLYNKKGDRIGWLVNNPLIYSNNNERAQIGSWVNVKVYGWVWTESLDNKCSLKKNENIRYRANTHIITKLYEGVKLDTLYTNEKKSWTLVSFDGFINTNCLISYEEYSARSWFKRAYFKPNVKVPVTKRYGGVSIKPRSLHTNHINYEALILPVRIVFSLFAFFFIMWFITRILIPLRVKNRRKKVITAMKSFAIGYVAGGILWLV
ncbi:MAG: hypothetical protein K8S00_00680 [Bacteroidales bacterium]|nr:hypothetical protein [Bacteroidales bacterium]